MMRFFERVVGLFLWAFGHLFLLMIAFFIGHGFDFFKVLFPNIISSHKEFLDNLAFPLALFALSELVVHLFRKSKKNSDDLNKKIEELSLKKIEDNIIKSIDKQLGLIKGSINEAIYNSYLREPNHIIDGFSETIRHFLQPHSGELVEPISTFMRDSLTSILENGFVKVNADFDDYRETSNRMVESIYKSPENNSIRMISLYSPLEYLHMNTVNKKIDAKKGKPNHLLVFNGYSVRNASGPIKVKEINEHTRGSTKRKRVVFLRKDELISLLRGNNDPQKSMFIFSYLWFLSMNTEIELGWGWKDEFRKYWYKESEENGDVDFMIFNQKYFWRYNLDEKCLYISWDPLTQKSDFSDPGNEQKLFAKSIEYFNKAKRIFNLRVDTDKKAYSNEFTPAQSLPSLLKEEGLFLEFKNALKKGLKTINDNKNKFSDLQNYHESEVQISIFLKTIDSFLDDNPDILDRTLENFERKLALSFKEGKLKEGELLDLYAYFFHGSFADGVKNIFPDIENDAAIF